MSGKECIIQSIIADAEKNAASIAVQATAESDEMLAKLNSELSFKYNNQIEQAKQDAEQNIKRRLTLAALDERKVILREKQRVIEQVYAQVLTKLNNMTDHIYREFMEGMLLNNAEDGDIVCVAERDAKRLHAAWLEGVAKKMKIHLSLSDENINSRGGVILRGKKYDKKITLEAMISTLKNDTEGNVAKRLFS